MPGGRFVGVVFFLLLSAADRLREYVKEEGTTTVRAAMVAELQAFSEELRDQERIIENFAIEQATVNTEAQRARGIERILWRVKLIGHLLHLVISAEIGTGVLIEESSAAA